MSIPTHTTALTLEKASPPLQLTLRSVPVPSPPPLGSCNVRVLAAPLSPTAPAILTGTKPLSFPTPFVPGVGAIGRVISVAADATLLRPGDLVLVDSFVRSRDDPETTQILLGLHGGPSEPQKALMRHVWRDGTFKTIATTPLENTHKLDEGVLLGKLGYTPSELAVALQRLAVVYGGMSAVGLRPGQTLIVGPATGHFSGAAAELGAALGARVVAVSRNAAALERLRDTLASTYPGSPPVQTVQVSGDAAADEAAIRAVLPAGCPGADAFIDVSPMVGFQPTHIPAAMACLRPGAKVALMGGMYGNFDVGYAGILYRNITIKGQWMYSRQEMGQALRIVEAGVVKLGKAAGYEVCGEFALEEWEAAVARLEGSDAWAKGVVFTPRDE